VKKSLDKGLKVWYIITMMSEKDKFPVGTKVRHKANPSIEGVVVGEGFGKPENKNNVRLQLTGGLTFDVTPYALKKVEQFIG
jgi:hypothetical protein|tara:strand:+ start:92 stop:337 length:246 start_codon:yes stop_codon:yes gene_type:complete